METLIKKWYSIGDIARLLDISPNTLRMYEDAGIVIPHRTGTNRRIYDEHDLEWLKKIRHLIKNEKMNIEGIRRLLALIPCWDINNCIEEKACPAYISKKQPCFEAKISCKNGDCHSCDVYRNFSLCDNLKNFLRVFNH